MPVKKFINKRPRISFSIIAAVCIGASLAVTQVQANIHSQSDFAQKNPHQIPDNLNPQPSLIESIVEPIHLEAKSLLDEVKDRAVSKDEETIHAMAFQGKEVSSRPTYDYTTGTSN
jgi:hypothetical protein